jgi:hypothetical protein
MCIYGIFKDSILGFIVSKLRKLPNLKNIQAIVNMPPPKDPQDPSIEWDGIILQKNYQKPCCYYGTYH